MENQIGTLYWLNQEASLSEVTYQHEIAHRIALLKGLKRNLENVMLALGDYLYEERVDHNLNRIYESAERELIVVNILLSELPVEEECQQCKGEVPPDDGFYDIPEDESFVSPVIEFELNVD